MPRNRPLSGIALLVAAFSGLAGCGRDQEISSYRIQKEPDAAQVAADAPSADQAGPGIQWTAPAGWKSQPAGGMRQGSFSLAGPRGSTADVSVVSFPGSGGDDLANINRWRNQLKLAPVSAEDLAGQVGNLAAPAGAFVLADLSGAAADGHPARILGAWLRQPDRVWFFKMMGSSDLVGSQRDAFIGFLRSVNLKAPASSGLPPAPATSEQANTNDLPRANFLGSAPPVPVAPIGTDSGSAPVQAGQSQSLVWTAPPQWRDLPGHPVRRGSYSAGGGTEVAITAFPGDVGGVLANVNRWRGQAGLPPIDDSGLAHATAGFECNGLHFLLVDASDAPTSMVAAMAPFNGGIWFFKLTGPAAAVASAKPAFLDFLRTVRAP